MIVVFIIVVSVLVLIDLYVFKGLCLLLSNNKSKLIKRLIYITYWSVNSLLYLSLIWVSFQRNSTRDLKLMSVFFYLFGVFIVLFVPKIVFLFFHLIDDIVFTINFLYRKITSIFSRKRKIAEGTSISRARFLSQTGLVLASIPFASLIYGMVKGRFDFRVLHQKIKFTDLPKAFDGLRIVQISDFHIGSFNGFHNEVKNAIKLINGQNPDLIVFTGDLINNFSEEVDAWIDILSSMNARIGKYAILGNHDYGNYYHWSSENEKQANFQRLCSSFEKFGFKLLRNSSVSLSAKDGSQIAIVGVENWGLPPFPQLGDYDQAVHDVSSIPFKILLSHDPSHWDAKIIGKQDVKLTLSGHTHGMQFGVKIGTHEWSPAQFKYPRWAGLYQEKNQYLYVNRGIGYIGYPGRVGMAPEITCIDLSC